MKDKVIFESDGKINETEFRNLFENYPYIFAMNYPATLKKLKENNHIRKSAVEEAGEMYKKWLNRGEEQISETIVMEQMFKAIQELKAENERLKK